MSSFLFTLNVGDIVTFEVSLRSLQIVATDFITNRNLSGVDDSDPHLTVPEISLLWCARQDVAPLVVPNDRHLSGNKTVDDS